MCVVGLLVPCEASASFQGIQVCVAVWRYIIGISVV